MLSRSVFGLKGWCSVSQLKFFTDAVPWLLTEYILVDDATQSIVLVKGTERVLKVQDR